MTIKDKVIAIVGPTASGKTALALMLAEKLNGEIISADSRQIYKEFNIAVAKPSKEETGSIAYHLIDFVEPTDDYTVANFADDAEKKIQAIIKNGKTPIITGGTGFYFRTLLQDFDLPRVPPNKALRKELEILCEEKGPEALHRLLASLDAETASKLHPNNTVKIIRAVEVCKTLNVPMSQVQSKKEAPYNVLWLGLNAQNRDFLYSKINIRVGKMMEIGLEEEASGLFNKYGKLPLLRNTIGYREFEKYFEGEIAREEAIDAIRQNTRRYAKRQLTWFRQNKDIHWFDIETDNYILEKALALCTQKDYSSF